MTHPDPLVRCTDSKIRIRTNMSHIRNTGSQDFLSVPFLRQKQRMRLPGPLRYELKLG